MKLQVTSTAFAHGKPIPAKYTCDGADISPPLAVANVPKATKSLALIMDDPDAPAGTWIHWIVFGLGPGTTSLPEGTKSSAPGGSVLGKNSWGRADYGGPCPPRGTHRYFFRVYALETEIRLPPGTTKPDLLAAMNGHILAQGELMGTYQRK